MKMSIKLNWGLIAGPVLCCTHTSAHEHDRDLGNDRPAFCEHRSDDLDFHRMNCSRHHEKGTSARIDLVSCRNRLWYTRYDRERNLVPDSNRTIAGTACESVGSDQRARDKCDMGIARRNDRRHVHEIFENRFLSAAPSFHGWLFCCLKKRLPDY